MYFKLIKNDLRKSKVITGVTVLFVTVATLLVSLAILLMVNLSGAIDELMIKAKTPHFLQMHTGTVDEDRMATFAKNNDKVEAYQVMGFVNISGDKWQIGEHSLAESSQDNGICVQSGQFDLLLGLNGEILQPQEGEIYVPLCYWQDGTISLGDQITIENVSLKVAGFLRDSQMNSLLASSKRFLVSMADYEKISAIGSTEYLIEFRLKDPNSVGAFESEYTLADLEANGPTITYGLFKMINALTDGIMIGIILIVSILVMIVALLCIRFTLLAKIEEEYKEIGTMKAIGLRVSDIKRIYLAKYAAIAIGGATLGYILALPLKEKLLESIRINFGESDKSYLAPIFSVISVILVAVVIILYVSCMLNRFKKISAAQAVRFGMAAEKVKMVKHMKLSKLEVSSANIFLGIKDVLVRKKLYMTMLLTIILSSFILLVPLNIHTTIASDAFMGLGRGVCDMCIAFSQGGQLDEKAEALRLQLAQDTDISKYTVLTTKVFSIKMPDETYENIKVELGDHSIFPCDYVKGKAPVSENEISLSALNAQAYEKKVGDTIKLMIDGSEKELVVSGIYSDFTNGGKSAKAIFNAETGTSIWCTATIDVKDKAKLTEKISEYQMLYKGEKVLSLKDFIEQTFGGTRKMVEKAAKVTLVVALVLVALITLLFMKMLVIKDQYSIAVIKAMGYETLDIKKQYLTRAVTVVVIGMLLGTLLGNSLGQLIAGQFIASLGVVSFKFVIDPLKAYMIAPLLMLMTSLGAAMIGISRIKEIKIAEHIKE